MDNKIVITVATTFELLAPGGEPAPIAAELRYDPDDPYAITIRFHTGHGEVEWMFGRELLADGLLSPTGVGDIAVRPSPEDPEQALVELNAPAGSAVLAVPSDDIAEFLDLSYDLVSPGEEELWIDFEAELAKLAIQY
ncbi:SsgA family sporulation/cell division regulator [Umezawaea sp. Da 62-37]|uniref:SsgA family sporulation/cell division regulator n=1 Tax=Umezawaea sp. Da 62-37 TaxID=3075927 RepID=UPI0028F6DE6B|nr:SsgA family sporulation/cell division regulator [Umezawaea sp. Da 62-37]WNV89324.1 SsgA family sporulation/cell division regulator [Umezawaea sp. Da 62-37]